MCGKLDSETLNVRFSFLNLRNRAFGTNSRFRKLNLIHVQVSESSFPNPEFGNVNRFGNVNSQM